MAAKYSLIIDFLNGGGSESTALSDPESSLSLTYGQLKQAIERAVETLSQAGVQPGDAVVFASLNSAALLVAILAVIKCGAVAVPINPESSVDELTYYVDDCEAVLLVASEDAFERCQQLSNSVTVSKLQNDFSLALDRVEQRQRREQFTDDTSLLIYTSGTTSRPKGVPLTSGNIMASVKAFVDCFRLSNADATIVPMPLFHVHGLIGATFSTLHTGGSIVFQPRFSASRFWPQVRQHKVSWYTASPTIHRILLKRKGEDDIPRGQLRFVRSSSASLGMDTLKEMEETFGTVVLEAYGMTEAANQVSCNPLPPRARKAGSVGITTGVDVRILDEVGNSLKKEQRGEVAVRGKSIMHGYHNKPEANLTAFTEDWFRTGDEGYIDKDGYVFIVGRIKELISRGGEKFSPVEVEEVLLRHPHVDEAACFGVPDPKYGEEIHAAVVAKPAAVIDVEDVLAFCAQHLNPVKVPKKIYIIESIPRTPTNKVQRQQLVRMFH
jgi:acyl-CoA synthetase (AMP-forming)/AMP-acid ligase II